MKFSVSDLRAAGVTDKQIVDALQEKQAKEREQARIRQRNHRARYASHGDMRDMRDMRDTSIEERKKVSKEGSIEPRASRGAPKTALPDDFHRELIGSQEFDRFCDYARANGRLYKDWEAAWRNWQRNAPRFNGNGGQHGRRRGSVLDAADRINEKAAEYGIVENYTPGTSGPRPLALDIKPSAPGLRLIPKG